MSCTRYMILIACTGIVYIPGTHNSSQAPELRFALLLTSIRKTLKDPQKKEAAASRALLMSTGRKRHTPTRHAPPSSSPPHKEKKRQQKCGAAERANRPEGKIRHKASADDAQQKKRSSFYATRKKQRKATPFFHPLH